VAHATTHHDDYKFQLPVADRESLRWLHQQHGTGVKMLRWNWWFIQCTTKARIQHMLLSMCCKIVRAAMQLISAVIVQQSASKCNWLKFCNHSFNTIWEKSVNMYIKTKNMSRQQNNWLFWPPGPAFECQLAAGPCMTNWPCGECIWEGVTLSHGGSPGVLPNVLNF